MPLVSVIIPTYKRNKFLLRAVNSVLSQTYNSFEIIIVDDNGRNTHYQIENLKNLKPLIQKNKNINYIILDKNVGGALARNEGAKIAKGDFLFFLDDDDIFLPEKIKIQIEHLMANPNIDANLSAFIRKDKNGIIYSKENFPRVKSFKNFTIDGNFFTPMLCIKKDFFLKINGFEDIKRYQDRLFMLKALKNNMKVETINIPLYIMYEHDGNRITNNDIEGSFKALNQIFDYIKHFKNEFTDNEWQQYVKRDNKAKGILLYNANYLTKLQSIKYWLKNLKIEPDFFTVKMLLKTLIPKL